MPNEKRGHTPYVAYLDGYCTKVGDGLIRWAEVSTSHAVAYIIGLKSASVPLRSERQIKEDLESRTAAAGDKQMIFTAPPGATEADVEAAETAARAAWGETIKKAT